MFLLYMAATNPFKNGSISTITDVDGMAYYIIPKGIRFFRAQKDSRYNITPDFSVLTLNPRAFFGVHNMDRDYIESYEDKYGVIFAFETTRPYKLLALDHPDTKATLYNRVPPNIRDVLRINYGYTMSGKRNSQLNSDLVLSQYLCDNGYQGYATDFIETDIDYFDPEFMICDVGGIKSLGRITNDPRRIDIIVERGKADKIRAELEAAREEKRKNRQRAVSPQPDDSASARFASATSSPFANATGSPFASSYGSPVAPSRFAAATSSPFASSYSSPGASYGSPPREQSRFANATSIPFASYDSPPRSPSKFAMASEIPKYTLGDMEYGEDDDENKENSPNRKGGLRKRKRRSYKKRKTRTNKRKRSGKKGTRRRRR